MAFRGRADGQPLQFEAQPLTGSDPGYGYLLRSADVSAQINRFGSGFLLQGRVAGQPVNLRVEWIRLQDYVVLARDGSRLATAWLTPSFAHFRGDFQPEKLDRRTLAVLGAGAALCSSQQTMR